MMALASTAVLLPAVAAAALIAVVAFQLLGAAAAAPPPTPPPIMGQPGCSTTCGNVSVPYPFGFGPSHCYWPGLNLTCDTSHDPPRLLLPGDGSLRVAEISLPGETVRVMRTGFIINTAGDLTSPGWNASLDFGPGFREHGYLLSGSNELVVSGCNVMATLSADIVGEETTKVVSGCASFCTKSDRRDYDFLYGHYYGDVETHKILNYCTGTSSCCRAPLTSSGVPKGVEARWLYSGNHTDEQKIQPVTVFVVEQDWIDEDHWADGNKETPFLLKFAVTQGLPQPNLSVAWFEAECPQDVRTICKSEYSACQIAHGLQGYACQCEAGYDGNPYLAGGCQDVDECKFQGKERVCFYVCINTNGSYECRCPQGTYGSPDVEGGCVDYNFNKDDLSPTVAPVPRIPGCNSTCGDVHVPYPFGFGPSRCYLPGFELTCDTSSHNPPWLLLHGNGNGTLQVVHISLRNSTLHVIHHSSRQGDHADVFTYDLKNTVGYEYNSYGHPSSSGILDAMVGLPHIGEPYVLSTRNEFIVFSGWDVRATLHGEHRNGSSSDNTDSIISRVVCSSGVIVGTQTHRGNCSGHDGCCRAPLSVGSTPKRVEFEVLNVNISHYYGNWSGFEALAFISELGLTHQWHKIFNMNGYGNYMSSPIVLQWAVKQGLPAPENPGKCPGDVVSQLCKSKHSYCQQENGGFTCHCSEGYDGNPYVADGCQGIDKCKILEIRSPCLDGYYCNNLPAGNYECRRINRFSTGLIIGLSVACVMALLFVPSILFLLRKFKQYRAKVLKQKYFKQNRGQLLQQLVSQKADIAERMIIPLDELVKATNNFDKARELGGGGHGTVYKGILSDLHVVAIKKSKITVQKEIDEFINEVAILSQINHKNVVKLFGCCLETEVPLLVYEFISNGTLYHHLHVEEPGSLTWVCRLRIATEIATSLAYLHSSVSIPIIHRDIKSSNILLDDTMTSKISDFGASRHISVDKTVLTTRVQGTIGYLDPMYFYTGRLTEKSDVYSFGVILVELLTRKKPFSYLSIDGDGLVSHFANLLSEEKLIEIMDPQVMEEGGTEVQEVAMLAASCINLRGEERPTMRDVEHILHGLQGPKRYNKDGVTATELKSNSVMTDYLPLSNEQGQRIENQSSRIYSLEQEMMMSARYPR